MSFVMVVVGVLALAAEHRPVRPGLEVLLGDSLHLVAGRRVGLVTNHAGVDREGRHAVDLLRAAGVRLTALFSPEHGFRGAADPGETVASTVDSATGLPIYSLYGRTSSPTAEMMADVDVLLIDLPDVGARYYTYPSTTFAVMKAAGAEGKPVIVLDRPNPIGGAIQGTILEAPFRSFIGSLEMPMRHGMTLGELARLAIGELDIQVSLTVVPADGWRRDLDGSETGLPFLAPSPNLQTLESLFHYPGTCLFEGTALSVGRGTDAAFRQVGAPWLDTAAVLRIVRGVNPPGVRFESVTFTPVKPGDGKLAGVTVPGIRLVLTDADRYDPIATALQLLTAIRTVHGDQIGFIEKHFDRLAGSTTLRKQLLAGESPERIVAGWQPGLAAFAKRRSAVALY